MSRVALATGGLMVWAPSPLSAANLDIIPSGTASITYDSTRDACEQIDVPDIDPRAFRDASGQVTVFALHFVNRALRGPNLDHVKIDCHVVLGSPLDPNPEHFADRNYIASTWTTDGKTVSALIHHEYHADQHGRCSVSGDLGCWYNSILAYKSRDGGRTFAKDTPFVVAAAPFREDVGQGRHRGFFSPSNMFGDGGHTYFFGSTTGWDGQPFGACLFRTATPMRPKTWRAYDGHAFSIAYANPYAGPSPRPKPCAVVAPFTFPVGAVVRHRTSGLWVAVLQASKTDTDFPVDGFYYATARDLRHWSAPKLLMAGQTIMSDLCKGADSVIGYPSILDESATSRNFDDVGDSPDLYFVKARVAGCGTSQRILVRQTLHIIPSP